jgi:riboflavin kinase/FMN adenylyltransferase
MDRRLGIIASLGVDFCVSAKFEDIRDMSAEEFCRVVLSDSIGCLACVVGYNFRFGRGASADAEELKKITESLGFNAVICPKMELFGIPVSSSAIREYLRAGDMKSANAMLGEHYSIAGEVVHGRGVGGKRLCTPTANLPHDEDTLLPRLGVYAAAAEVDKRLYPAAANLGVCPTYGGLCAHTEAYIIGFDGNLYGKKIKLSFLSFLRDEVRFENEEMLKMQIELDKNATIKEFNYRND